MNTATLTTWLKDNAVPVVILVIGIVLLLFSRKGETSKVMTTAGLSVVGLAVVAIALTPALGINVGTWALRLLGIA